MIAKITKIAEKVAEWVFSKETEEFIANNYR